MDTVCTKPNTEKPQLLCSDSTTLIIYEQPLNEYIRVCLRLEQLFQRARQALQHSEPWQHRVTLEMIIQILNVIDRRDLKSRLCTALTQHGNRLTQLQTHPHVDPTKLQNTIDQIDNLVDSLYQQREKLGGSLLQQNAFLENIRQHMAAPGGACHFNTPAYHLWLNQDFKQRGALLQQWLQQLAQLEQIAVLLLQLTRSNGNYEPCIAQQGFYQAALGGSKNGSELIRVRLPAEALVYPEISVGRHRLSIRFLKLNTHSTERRPIQTHQDTYFDLACCNYTITSLSSTSSTGTS